MIDWSSTAAWITLAVTLAFSIASPVITTFMNNRFQLKMVKLNFQQKAHEDHYLKKREIIEAFVSNTGKCIFYANIEVLRQCGENFYPIYIYTPENLWSDIDEMLDLISNKNWSEAKIKFASLSKSLADVLAEADLPDQHK